MITYTKHKFLYTWSVFLVALGLYVVPYVVNGQGAATYQSGEVNVTRSVGTTRIENPIRAQTITELLLAILRIVMIIAVPIVIFFIVFAGFKYVTARGNSEQIQEATRALTYAIIGGLIVLGALVLVAIIQNLVAAFGVTGE